METTEKYQKETKITLWLTFTIAIILLIALITRIIPSRFWVVFLVISMTVPIIYKDRNLTIEEVRIKRARMVKKGAWGFVVVYGIFLYGFPFGLFMALEDWSNTAEFISEILAAMLIGGTIFGSLMYVSLKKSMTKIH